MTTGLIGPSLLGVPSGCWRGWFGEEDTLESWYVKVTYGLAGDEEWEDEEGEESRAPPAGTEVGHVILWRLRDDTGDSGREARAYRRQAKEKIAALWESIGFQRFRRGVWFLDTALRQPEEPYSPVALNCTRSARTFSDPASLGAVRWTL